MPEELDFGFAPEILSEGTPEERAAFGLLTIRTSHGLLTEGWDSYLDGSRPGPLVSAYHAAEWFAWNWWRLRWEPRRPAPDSPAEWELAHRMNSIGEGYVWPNITIFSDGERIALLSAKSLNPEARPFRYFGANPMIVQAHSFEAAVDGFVGKVLARLQSQGVTGSNLERVWSDILAERSDPLIARRRKIEAMLGRDPDAVEDGQVDGLIRDASELGEGAVEEIAADQEHTANSIVPLMTAQQLHSVAEKHGFDGRLSDAARLHGEILLHRADVPAWKLGAMAAQQLRDQEKLGWNKIGDIRLAALAGTRREALGRDSHANQPISYILSGNDTRSKTVLRSKWKDGRRFELARLIGDNLLNGAERLHPATRAYTYRQKAQRSFAAELLSPFRVVDDMLGGDYSVDAQEDVARHFAVSPMTINTLLKNHGRIERDDPEQHIEAINLAAA
ncbi:hypothetical protein [Sphingobium yanoikuyae]|uniref:hypothetical protein n=1 Tax=Sphingobium yanoikuyae TaxID=13690 RepID=UPI0028B05005|nr:hypothetical protein [Sphingobium yanoikuyae]